MLRQRLGRLEGALRVHGARHRCVRLYSEQAWSPSCPIRSRPPRGAHHAPTLGGLWELRLGVSKGLSELIKKILVNPESVQFGLSR